VEQGNLYLLPAEEDPGGDPKDRAHLVVSLVDPLSDLVTLAYCSTRSSEADLGSPHVLVDPSGATFAVTGLREATYVYPSRLVTEEILRLGQPIGRVLDEMPAVRRELRLALGIGLGTAHTPGPALGGLRGQLIQLGPTLAEQLTTRYAVVVANPTYARKQRYLNIVPLFDSDEYEPASVDLVCDRRQWAAGLALPERVLICISAICSCYGLDPNHLDAVLGRVVDDATTQSIDDGLLRHFFAEADR
jgi:hypothetical protein